MNSLVNRLMKSLMNGLTALTLFGTFLALFGVFCAGSASASADGPESASDLDWAGELNWANDPDWAGDPDSLFESNPSVAPVIDPSSIGQDPWFEKPLLSYALLRPGGFDSLRMGAGLTEEEAEAVYTVALQEQGEFMRLRALDLDARAFNRAVEARLEATDRQVREALSDDAYRALRAWALQEFLQRSRGDSLGDSHGDSAGIIRPQVVDPLGYRFRVFATQFYVPPTPGGTPPSNPCTVPPSGPAFAAVPDKYVKFANLGWTSLIDRPGYDNPPYEVRIHVPATGVTRTVRVDDVGPWNIDDNYWNDSSDLRARRDFPTLPRGLPEAEAAFLYDFNGGKDASGRTVLNPAGIDLTMKLAEELGLAPCENAWVDVTFLWEVEEAPAVVWPGDTNDDGLVDARDVLPIARYWGATGGSRAGDPTVWSPQPLPGGWAEDLMALADASGDGVVDASDVEIVRLHWGNTR